MKIKKELPQFENSKALFLVSGKQSGKIYLINNGEVKEESDFEINNPVYSDREGHFMKAGSGKDLAQGSVYEDKSEYVITKYLKLLQDKVKKTIKEESPDLIYLFAPDYLLPKIQESIPSQARKMIKETYKGNYTKETIFSIISKTKNEKDNKAITPTSSKDAIKLIKKEGLVN